MRDIKQGLSILVGDEPKTLYTCDNRPLIIIPTTYTVQFEIRSNIQYSIVKYEWRINLFLLPGKKTSSFTNICTMGKVLGHRISFHWLFLSSKYW